MDHGTKLLLGCLKNGDKEVKLQLWQSFSAAEWEEVFVSSTRSSLTPLLYHTLKPCLDKLPKTDGVREKLQQIYYFSAIRNMRLYSQLLDLVTLFNKEQVPVILLKGSHMAELVYGNIALRPMADMDLLIRPADLEKADRLLKSQGYSSSDLLQDRGIKRLAPFSKKGSVIIEIHYQITVPPFSKRFAIEELWERSRREIIEGVEVLTLSPEDLLLHLCAHASIDHGFEFGILPFIDVARSVDHYREEIDWVVLFERAETWGIQQALYLFLALTEKMIGTNIPGFISAAFKSDSESVEVLAVAEEIVFGRKRGTSIFVASLFGAEPLWVKFRLIMKRLFRAEEFISNPISEEKAHRQNCFVRTRAHLLWLKKMYGKYKSLFWCALRGDSETVELMNKRNRLRKWLEQG